MGGLLCCCWNREAGAEAEDLLFVFLTIHLGPDLMYAVLRKEVMFALSDACSSQLIYPLPSTLVTPPIFLFAVPCGRAIDGGRV